MYGTFNCRSAKSSVYKIQDLCAKSDSVCLQEHWLLSNEVNLLSQMSVDFLAAGFLAIDINEDILTSRLYGGIAILHRKYISPFVSDVTTCTISIVVRLHG